MIYLVVPAPATNKIDKWVVIFPHFFSLSIFFLHFCWSLMRWFLKCLPIVVCFRFILTQKKTAANNVNFIDTPRSNKNTECFASEFGWVTWFCLGSECSGKYIEQRESKPNKWCIDYEIGCSGYDVVPISIALSRFEIVENKIFVHKINHTLFRR